MPELSSVTLRANHSTAIKALATGAAALAILLLFRAYSYLLFHTVAELYSIVIAITYFVIAWHTRGVNENPTIATLGIAYVFIAILDTFHTLAFTGMNIFQGYAFPANQLWILGRFLEALSLAGFSFISLRGKPRLFAFLACYVLYTAAGLAAVFVFRSFPVCFIAGQGQTPFKLAAEYSIIAILAIASILLYRRRGLYPRPVHRRLQVSILLTILAELSFTLYFSNYDWANMTGHFFKIASFYLVYRSIVVTGLERPQELFYARLRQSEQALRRANATQNAIISILSHDLKGPLSAVKNLAESVSGEAGAFPAQEERFIVSEIALAVGRSLALLERTLEWARASRGELEQHTEALSLSEAARRALDFLANNAREKSITLFSSVPDEAEVLADRDMLDFILRNLTQNAIKFTSPGGAVRLSAWREASSWVLAVEDSGVGMDEAELASLFTIGRRFHKAGTAGEQGTGLGLVLCQDFAAKMGGSITAASEAGKGSILRLSLPGADKLQRGS
jgi:signal transduction histidine kinase